MIFSEEVEVPGWRPIHREVEPLAPATQERCWERTCLAPATWRVNTGGYVACSCDGEAHLQATQTALLVQYMTAHPEQRLRS